MQARAEAVGLGTPELAVEPGRCSSPQRFPVCPMTRPRSPAPVQERWLEIRQGETIVLDRGVVKDASIRLDETGAAYTWIDIDEASVAGFQAVLDADPEGDLTFYLDDEVAAVRPNSRSIKDGGLRIVAPGEVLPAARMKIAADTSIALAHGPLPVQPVGRDRRAGGRRRIRGIVRPPPRAPSPGTAPRRRRCSTA